MSERAELPAFDSTGSPFLVTGRGWVYPVKNPGGYAEPADLTGQDVLIDGEQHHVRGVESFMIARPYPDHLDFGLLVSADAEQPTDAAVGPEMTMDTEADRG